MISLSPKDQEVYLKYANLALPRHTSYPIVPTWDAKYNSESYSQSLLKVRDRSDPVSVYIHVPFCRELCYYCACTKEIVSDKKRFAHDPVPSFLDGIEKEMDRVTSIIGKRRVRQFHLGGGTPTFLNCDQLKKLWELVTERFSMEIDAEISIEVDPKVTSDNQLKLLKELGFNRISLGVQDFDPLVQKTVNRVYSYEDVGGFVERSRGYGFKSVNFDLIYGLPHQTVETMQSTLEKVVTLSPDRIAFYRLAVMPDIFKWQKSFTKLDLPQGSLTQTFMLMAMEHFQASGYEFIGLDHFAKPDEALACARRDGSLTRTFQGMTTHDGLDILGFGPSSVTSLNEAFAQNTKGFQDWISKIENGFATERGCYLGKDDPLRQKIIQHIYCYGELSLHKLYEKHSHKEDVSVAEYFKVELENLKVLANEGFITFSSDFSFKLTYPLGRLLVRVVASIFDAYIPKDAFKKGISTTQASKIG